jgi:hypothetical protein
MPGFLWNRIGLVSLIKICTVRPDPAACMIRNGFNKFRFTTARRMWNSQNVFKMADGLFNWIHTVVRLYLAIPASSPSWESVHRKTVCCKKVLQRTANLVFLWRSNMLSGLYLGGTVIPRHTSNQFTNFPLYEMHKLIPFFNFRANFRSYELLPLANRSLFPSGSNGKLIFVLLVFALRAVLEERIKLVNRGITVLDLYHLYFICGLFNDATSISDCIASNDEMINK